MLRDRARARERPGAAAHPGERAGGAGRDASGRHRRSRESRAGGGVSLHRRGEGARGGHGDRRGLGRDAADGQGDARGAGRLHQGFRARHRGAARAHHPVAGQRRRGGGQARTRVPRGREDPDLRIGQGPARADQRAVPQGRQLGGFHRRARPRPSWCRSRSASAIPPTPRCCGASPKGPSCCCTRATGSPKACAWSAPTARRRRANEGVGDPRGPGAI